jgi:hypothetical protein
MPADHTAARAQLDLKGPQRSPWRVADVLRAHAAEYRRTRGDRLSWAERHALGQLTACRTAALGGHAWACNACGEVQVAYNSCRHRHCPTCGGPARAQWLQRMRADILPVPYFHLVFTLPHELSRLALANRRALYGLPFRSAWQTLRQLAADPEHLGARVAAVMVLHTWGQNLEHHPHVHCVVPGGGLSPDGQQWISSRPNFFLPVRALSRLFRGKFLAGLKHLHCTGRLRLFDKLSHLADAKAFQAWLAPLYTQDWVVYVQPPVDPQRGPEAVLKYLARYVAGAAISDQRLLSHADGQVTFAAKNYRQGRKRQRLTLPGVEFVRRFLLHVLPRGFPRIRYYGLLANTQRALRLPRCRQLLGATPAGPADLPVATAAEPLLAAEAEAPNCPACGRGWLVLIESYPRPAWSDQSERTVAVPPACSSLLVTAPRRSDSS